MSAQDTKVSQSFQAFLDDADAHGIAARLYVHVHMDGQVSVFEEGAEAVVLQGSILTLEYLTEKAKRAAGDN